MEFELLSIPAILALVEAAKMAGLPVKLAPVLAILAGVVAGYLMGDVTNGIIFGLSASGIYSGAKTLTK